MSIKSRLARLEVKQGIGRPRIPWSVDDPDATGVEVDGRFLTWDEFAREYPNGPWPLRWDAPGQTKR